MRLIILCSIFGVFCSLAYVLIPHFMRQYSQIQKKRMEKVSKQLDQMFVFQEKRKLIPVLTIIPLTLGVAGFILFQSPIAAIGGVCVGITLPSFVVKMITAQRRAKFEAQLVDGLMVLSSSLRAGMSLTLAFEVLVEELEPPISDEFALVVRANQMGMTIQDCLTNLKRRIQIEDLDLITTSINISRETGGDLTEIFSQLVFTMREKQKLDNRVKALTVQGKLQGLIMGFLPIGFALFMYSTNPDNLKMMWTDEIGRIMLIAAVVLECIGAVTIKIFSKVRV